MADRTDQVTKTRDDTAADVDLDAIGDDDEWWRDSSTDSASGATASRSSRSSGGGESRLSGYFSPRVFLLSLLVATAGVLGGGMVLPFLGNLAGLFAAAFGAGLLSSKRRYAEMGLAGGVVLGVSSFFNYFALAVVSGGALPLLAATGGLGLVLGVLGVYFGRDLRGGLTADI